MNSFRFLIVLAIVFAWRSAAQAEYAPAPGSCAVATFAAVWHDATRDRDIPIKIYYPTGEHAPKQSPVVIFSHGLGGSREMYEYLGNAWAAHGYISVHPQHHGSDLDLLTETKRPLQKIRNFKKAAADPDNLVNRPKDIAFVIDQLAVMNDDAKSVFHGRMDLQHLGLAGHSFGAYTTMAVAGQAIGPAAKARYFGPDSRVIAAIAMSSQPAAVDNLEHAYDRIRIPIFHMTGTADQSIGGHGASADDGGMGHTSAAGRRIGFDHTKNATAYLLTFKEGDHMVFSGRDPSHDTAARKLIGTEPNPKLTPELRSAMHRIVVDASLAFWEATLRGNVAAEQWLDSTGFTQELGNLGTFEQKHPASSK